MWQVLHNGRACAAIVLCPLGYETERFFWAMTHDNCAAIVLAAGMGTRMGSDLPKVLHPIANRPMISHILTSLGAVSPERTVVVLAPGMAKVAEVVAPAETVIQAEALGTGHAVLAACDALERFTDDVLVLCGDTPLLTAETIKNMLSVLRESFKPSVVVLGFRPNDPAEYGRLVTGVDGSLEAIVEFQDASDEQRRLGLCNAGIMAIDGKQLRPLLDAIGNRNAKKEYYFTDIVQIARKRGLNCRVVEASDPDEVMGVNNRSELAKAEVKMQARLRENAMANGATMTDPSTVWLSADTIIGKDVSIAPNVFIGAGVTIQDNVVIRSFFKLYALINLFCVDNLPSNTSAAYFIGIE